MHFSLEITSMLQQHWISIEKSIWPWIQISNEETDSTFYKGLLFIQTLRSKHTFIHSSSRSWRYKRKNFCNHYMNLWRNQNRYDRPFARKLLTNTNLLSVAFILTYKWLPYVVFVLGNFPLTVGHSCLHPREIIAYLLQMHRAILNEINL